VNYENHVTNITNQVIREHHDGPLDPFLEHVREKKADKWERENRREARKREFWR
jgi:hypothetical protein